LLYKDEIGIKSKIKKKINTKIGCNPKKKFNNKGMAVKKKNFPFLLSSFSMDSTLN